MNDLKTTTMEKQGTLSIHTENIFPIIKKFLYSDNEIFLRELVSNAVDASQKLLQLAALGEYKGKTGDMKITVSVDEKAKKITISDRGVGMTAEEIDKYINQIAFSGATEFVEKYKDKMEGQQIIGHFGLGFYSSFMVAEKVEVITRSCQEGAEAAKWTCDGSTTFSIEKAVKKERGTDIVLHIGKEGEEFLEKSRLQSILDKHCRFLPVEIEFDGKVINTTKPAWTKKPADLKEEDYKAFYKDLYPFSQEPLFWIHLNVDYPFNLTGILYFPKLGSQFEQQKNKIQLYCKQVFVTDEVTGIVPEFLTLLHGVIDSPDIPLNVSRSYLQSDSNVKKISNHITKKVADKLEELFKEDRKSYEAKWEDIGVFVKYGIISEEKFAEKTQGICLLKNTEGKHFTLDEYKKQIEGNQKDKDNKVVVLYCNNTDQEDAYIQTARNRGYDVLLFDGPIDSHLINYLEGKEENISFKRVDSEAIDRLIDKGEAKESVLSDNEKKKVEEVFKEAVNNDKASIAIEAMDPSDLPVAITLPEFLRRMKDMSVAAGGGMPFMEGNDEPFNIVINGNHALVQKITKAKSKENKVKIARQAYDLALLSQGMLKGTKLTEFIKRSVDLAIE